MRRYRALDDLYSLPECGRSWNPDQPLLSVQGNVGTRSVISALYVETNGHYFGVEGVDPWDINRDARNYEGPHPVVAHPPCHLWVNFAALNFKRYGGEHNRPGNDGGCFGSALNSVRRWCGVLEHPAHTNAWRAFSLIPPTGIGWNKVGAREWVCEVWQSAYGHKARKRTWLYYVGANAPAELDWSRNPGTAQCGWFDRIKPTLSKKEASRTPVAFRDALIGLARNARRTTGSICDHGSTPYWCWACAAEA